MLLAVIGVHILLCLILIGLVLMQQGKGASVGASFGGSSNTVFGAAGAGNVLTKATTIVAILFMITSIALVKLYASTSVSEIGIVSDPLKGSIVAAEVAKEEQAAAAAKEASAAPSAAAAAVTSPIAASTTTEPAKAAAPAPVQAPAAAK